MPLNPSGQISLAGPSTGQSIAIELGQSATATISLNDTNVRTLAQVASGVIVMPTDFWGKSNFTPTQKAIFGYGRTNPTTRTAVTNLVSSSGVVASDTPGVGTARNSLAAASYGGDKAIFGFGVISPGATNQNITNLVSNTGAVSADTPGVGTARNGLAAAGYGGNKAIFFGSASYSAVSNLVSNTGVVASDTPGAPGVAGKDGHAAASYGGDKAIFGFGRSAPTTMTNNTNLVSNTGVISADTPGVGTVRNYLAAASYGTDKAIFGYGQSPTPTPTYFSLTNLVSNTGVVASDTSGVGTVRDGLAAAGYGGDKAIFGYGRSPGGVYRNLTNLVSNTGVVASDTPGVGSNRYNLAAAGYSTTA